jgi:uncharacterized protein (DUF1697 family)
MSSTASTPRSAADREGDAVKYAIFLRGVNVGGRGKLSMSDLRGALENAGFADVSTYLQSGNAVVSVPGRSAAAKVAGRVEAAIVTALGASPQLVVRTHRELTAVIDGNPFPAAAAEKPAWLHVFFLSAPPDPEAPIAQAKLGPDRYAFGDRCVYLHFVNSPGTSRSGELVCREALRPHEGAFATARNWNTVLAMADRTA